MFNIHFYGEKVSKRIIICSFLFFVLQDCIFLHFPKTNFYKSVCLKILTLQHFHLLHFHFSKWKLCLKLSQIPECVFKSFILLIMALYESLWTCTLFLKLPLNFKFESSQHLCYVLFKSYWIYTVYLKFSKLLSFISKTLGHLFGVSLNIGKHFSELRLISRLTLS